MEWAAFCLTIAGIANRRGTGFVSAALHPHPLADVIEGGPYPVPVRQGPRGIVNAHGQDIDISAFAQPA